MHDWLEIWHLNLAIVFSDVLFNFIAMIHLS